MNSMSNVRIASSTHEGRRSHNEDSCLALSSSDLHGKLEALLIVADGIGGRASGHIASSIAVESVQDAVTSELANGNYDMEKVLDCALRSANVTVYKESLSKPELNGMGTTCVTACIRDGRAYVAHLGDSRAYLLRHGRLQRLTEDHSFVAEQVRLGEITEEEARRSRFRNVITRAVGLEPDATPEITKTDLQPGDVLLLCTDGLSGPVKDTDIADIVRTSSSLEEACQALTKAALKNGGTDNITIALAAYGQPISLKPNVGKREARLLPMIASGLIGILLGISIGALLPFRSLSHKNTQITPTKPVVTELAELEYNDPVSLYFAPIQDDVLAIDPLGRIYVADLQGRLLCLDSGGKLLFRFPKRDVLEPVDGMQSTRITIDRQGNLYLIDTGKRWILKYGSDGLLLDILGAGKLTHPSAVGVDKSGSIYVIDGRRLKVFRSKNSLTGNE